MEIKFIPQPALVIQAPKLANVNTAIFDSGQFQFAGSTNSPDYLFPHTLDGGTF